MLTALAGASQGVPVSPRRLPVDDALAGIATALWHSADVTERLAAATLFAAHNADPSRAALTHMARLDADVEVRAAAIRALGSVGDRETLAFLEAYPLPAQGEPRRVLQAAVRAALSSLRRRV